MHIDFVVVVVATDLENSQQQFLSQTITFTCAYKYSVF